MRLLVFLSVFCFSLCFSIESILAGQMSSTNYQITSSALSGGGIFMSSAHYQLFSTLGQPTPDGDNSSTNYAIDTGFWYTILVTSVGDVNADGRVNLEDAVIALHVVTGQSASTIIDEADADGDGKIGLGEAVHILRKLSD